MEVIQLLFSSNKGYFNGISLTLQLTAELHLCHSLLQVDCDFVYQHTWSCGMQLRKTS